MARKLHTSPVAWAASAPPSASACTRKVQGHRRLRPEPRLRKVAGRAEGAGYTFYASVGNVGDWDSTVAAFAQAKAEHGAIDVLVNNAGITRDRVFPKMTPSRLGRGDEHQPHQPVQRHQAGDRRHGRKGWGRIVNISSVNGEKGQAGQTNYSAAKAGTRLHDGAGAGSGQQGRDGEHREPGLHRHRHGQGDPPGRARQDRRRHPGQAPGHAGRDRLHRRLAGSRRGVGLQ